MNGIMAKAKATVVWTLERLRERTARDDRACAVLLSSIVRTWGYELALLTNNITLYTRTYDDDTMVSLLSLPGGKGAPSV